MKLKEDNCGYDKEEGIAGSVKQNLENGCRGDQFSAATLVAATILKYAPFVPLPLKSAYMLFKVGIPGLTASSEWLSGEGPKNLATKLTGNEELAKNVAEQAKLVSDFVENKVVPVSVGIQVGEEYLVNEAVPALRNFSDNAFNYLNGTYHNYTDCYNQSKDSADFLSGVNDFIECFVS
jgi:hypothetical protein